MLSTPRRRLLCRSLRKEAREKGDNERITNIQYRRHVKTIEVARASLQVQTSSSSVIIPSVTFTTLVDGYVNLRAHPPEDRGENENNGRAKEEASGKIRNVTSVDRTRAKGRHKQITHVACLALCLREAAQRSADQASPIEKHPAMCVAQRAMRRRRWRRRR